MWKSERWKKIEISGNICKYQLTSNVEVIDRGADYAAAVVMVVTPRFSPQTELYSFPLVSLSIKVCTSLAIRLLLFTL